MILSIGASIGIFACCLFFLIFESAFMMIKLNHNGTKKSWSKVKELYPYFSYPFVKKIFFLGLKGKMPFVIVLLSFIMNISLVFVLSVTIWNIILANVVASYILRISGLVSLILFFVRGIIWLTTEIKL